LVVGDVTSNLHADGSRVSTVRVRRMGDREV
jgi:hypothetical protein